MPRTSRQQASSNKIPEPVMDDDGDRMSSDEDSEGDERETAKVHTFNGIIFETYQDMVDAKRQRNEQRLVECGLMQAKEIIQEARGAAGSKRGLASKKRKSELPLPRRKSNRIAGIESDGVYVEHESAGVFTTGIVGQNAMGAGSVPESDKPDFQFFNERLNDGAKLSVKEATELSGSKWVDEMSVGAAEQFVSFRLAPSIGSLDRKVLSPNSVADVSMTLYQEKFEGVSVDDDKCVAKVTPDRIYSIVCHPSENALIVGAGDKQGFVGLWNVDHRSDGSNHGVHLFRLHGRPVSCLEWTPSGDKLVSASYDGSVRSFDVASQTFTEVFATYDDSATYGDKLGHGIHQDYKFWVQHVAMDRRFNTDKCFFLSTSAGSAIHVDLRVGKGKLTFNEDLSAKKINTLSLHPNGFSLASAGLDCMVRLWDIRKFGSSRNKESKDHSGPEVVAEYHAGRSVNSAFFSPSGSHLVATTQMNTLDMLHDCHLSKDKFKPTTRVNHDNMTGRWLTTFNANWHPSLDLFVVGSMQKPRAIEVFDGHGKKVRDFHGVALTAVASRCCFHPSTDKVVIVGGNSSGRVSVVR